MIRFHCPQCHKAFQVAVEFAGRSARCKACNHAFVVPQLATVDPDDSTASAEILRSKLAAPADRLASLASSAAPALPAKLSMRERRLRADAEQMVRHFAQSPVIRVEPKLGDPAELYLVEYRLRGLMRGPDGKPVACERHVAQLQLTRDYPRQAPKCRLLTPIFHPNIEPSTICVGDHWTAGERLVDLVIRIGEMIAFQAYNVKSPLDGEAAMWADLNQHRLPTDSRDLRSAEMS